LADDTSEFLTNAPTTQYANLEDYGTLSMVTTSADLYQIRLNYYDSDNNYLNSDTIARNSASGAWSNPWTARFK
jgi:hypothetical protein